jgi:hypothetical protein
MSVKQIITEMCCAINEFSKGYQVRYNLEKDENGVRLADFYSILNGCKNHLSQFLNLRAADDFMQMVTYTAKLQMPELSALNSLVIEKVSNTKSQLLTKF